MSKRKLLLADDSITIQKVVNLTFADEGFEVVSVGDGNSAMDKLREDSPDLVLADVNMPGLNGYEICEKIKDINKNTPVILLVGSFEPFDEDEAKRVGADDYLTKPFQSISQLVSKVTDLLNSSKQENLADSDTQIVEDQQFSGFDDSSMDDEMIQTDQIGSLPSNETNKFETQIDKDEETTSFADTSDTYGLTEKSYQFNEDSSENEPDEVSFEQEQDFIDTQEIENKSEEIKEEEEKETAEIPVPEAASIFELDEMDLLELPLLDIPEEEFQDEEEAGSFEEIDSDESPIGKTFAVEAEKETVSPYTSTETFEEPEVKISEPESKEISNEAVSSDMVEVIAQRVVEKLSDKVIKEIAWEVVPQMADLIIKKMAEEKMKD